ncbi:thymidine kinase [Marinomonas primoryensis]|jgi:thymidine kinase|uniref:Thymidine kinase n=2 Tax=Marinomonas TaxID=28253 RepID=A0A2Z4PW23_9GAMM|nr:MULTISPECIES: thymidine kinase [Marinomonas]AWY01349.1 thymidine kinase [Marinomonas primoryensis]MDE8602351.1 thymidine kinase [Marinomonas maritima]|tara:strand:+ start:15374 stop:15955 length:582 start_codon:yes stop_codon:yes gene_type:complete
MAKLYFYYSAMNAGKSTVLLQSAHNYQERGMRVLLLTASIDNRFETGQIASRIGISADASLFDNSTDMIALIKEETHQQQALSCILIDEAQFLTKEQVYALSEVVDKLHIPVLAFGIRTDFQGELFDGSKALLAWSDKLIELKTVCHCGSKATMVIRLNAEGIPVKEGAQVEIGGNDRYLSVCRKHFKEAVRD